MYILPDMAHEIAVFGHSFVSRLRTHAVQGMGQSNLRLDAGEFRVFMHGVSGLTLARAREESDVVVNLTPHAIILELGANDLDHVSNPHPCIVADKIMKFAEDLRVRANSQCIMVVMAFPRRESRRVNYNDVMVDYNSTLRHLEAHYPNVYVWPHKNMMAKWEDMIHLDGVHLNNFGLGRYFRSIRGACMKAVSHM